MSDPGTAKARAGTEPASSRWNRWAARADRAWRRHRRAFWIVHSVWALATGVVVLWLAHERYGFVPWVVGFLLLTWASTMLLGRGAANDAERGFGARIGRELASYLTRVMYQETLFFLLPFYVYSTVIPSWNMVFPAVLALLAVLACLDLVFDRWLRQSPVFGLVFFATVAFAAANLLIPMTLSVEPAFSTPLSALLAVATAVPLAAGVPDTRRRSKWRLVAVGVALLVVAVWLRPLVPPVPLRLRQATFSESVDRSTLASIEPIASPVPARAVGNRLCVVAEVFAPSVVPSRVAIDWYRDGVLVRRSREVEIVAHTGGFRLWDALRTEGDELEPGRYRVVLRTADDRIFGAASLRLHGSSPGE